MPDKKKQDQQLKLKLDDLPMESTEESVQGGYSAGDTTGGHEEAAEMLTFYLRGKSSE